MLLDLIHHLFTETGQRWRIGGTLLIPTEDDIKRILDEAAGRLYNEKRGTTLETGGLIIEKTTQGYDVYVRVGSYT